MTATSFPGAQSTTASHRSRWTDLDIRRVVGWVDEPSGSAVIRALTDAGEWDEIGYTSASSRVRSLGTAIATWLAAHGHGADTPVAVIAPTAIDTVIAYWAVLDSGAALVPLSPPGLGEADTAAEKIAGILEVSGAPLVLASEEFAPLAAKATQISGSATRIVSAGELLAQSGSADTSADEAARDRGHVALLQFTSGSTGSPRGVVISWEALAHNLDMIAEHVGFAPGDGFCSWLPMFHDMGLVGIVLLSVSTCSRLELMRPDQFIRRPERYLEMLSRCQHSASPSFGLGYTAFRLRDRELPDIDLSGFRSLVIGSEPLRAADICGFLERFGKLGFTAAQIRPAYGLAESTLMSCSTRIGEPMRALALSGDTALGRPAVVAAEWSASEGGVPSAGEKNWSFCVGSADADLPVTICDSHGSAVPAGIVGEICVSGPSIAEGYLQTGDAGVPDSERTRFDDGVLRTGDAGFLHDGGLYVLGRIGTSLKSRGRTVFMEDLDAAVSTASGLPGGRVAAAASPQADGTKVLLALETPRPEQVDAALTALRSRCGDHEIEVREVPRGFIPRTSSGKPRRHELIRALAESAHTGIAARAGRSGTTATPTTYVDSVDAREIASADADILALWDAVASRVDVPSTAGILHEGSLAEGFGNARSDVDFLVVIEGSASTPTMPTVLFEQGRRVEVRTRSEAELRAQLDRLTAEAPSADDPDPESPSEDVLNRCQRLAGAKLVRNSAVIGDLVLPRTNELAGVLHSWWSARAQACRARAVAARALGNAAGEAGWIREAGIQALKADLAGAGETYLESKWLAEQLRRAGDASALELVEAAGGAGPRYSALWAELARHRLGSPEPTTAQLFIERVPEVTTWIIGARVHIVRGRDDVFAMTPEYADAWRRVVPGRSLHAHVGGNPARDAALAEVLEWALDLGLVALSERRGQGRRPVRPAMSMVSEAKAASPPPVTAVPALTLAGASTGRAGIPFVRSALPAEDFAACGMALVWSLMVTENAREDLDGALRSEQWGVASASAARVVLLCSRLVLTSCGVYPLPADVQPARSLRMWCPQSPQIDALAERVDELLGEQTSADAIRADPGALIRRLDELVDTVRALAIGADFPSSYDGPAQWNATLKIAYDWLRLGGYLDATLPLDEARDLVESGGMQPHAGLDTTESERP